MRSGRRVGRRRHRQRRGRGVAGTGIPLAIVPGGSGNGLARDLALPFDPTAALDDRGDRQDPRHRCRRSARLAVLQRRRHRPRRAHRGTPGRPRASPRVDGLRARHGRRAALVRSRARIRSARRLMSTVSALIGRPRRSAGAVHRARQLAPVRQRRADRAQGAAGRRHDGDRGCRAAVGLQIARQLPAFFGGRLQEGPRHLDAVGLVDGHFVRRSRSRFTSTASRGPARLASVADAPGRLAGQGKSLDSIGTSRVRPRNCYEEFTRARRGLGEDSRLMRFEKNLRYLEQTRRYSIARHRRRAGKCAKSATAKWCGRCTTRTGTASSARADRSRSSSTTCESRAGGSQTRLARCARFSVSINR